MPSTSTTDGLDSTLREPSQETSDAVTGTPITPRVGCDASVVPYLSRTDQLFIGILAVSAFVVFAIDYARLSGFGSNPVEIVRLSDLQYEYKLDINHATWVEWALLDGIGEILAKRIVADREQNGPFVSIDDLVRVHGIGPKRLAKMRPSLTIGERKDGFRSSIAK